MERNKFTPETELEITQRYTNRESTSGLAKEYGCSVGTIREIAKRNGAPVFPRGNKYREFTDEEIAEMDRMWASGASQTTIAAKFNSKQITISRALRSRGVHVTSRVARGSRVSSWKGGRIRHPSGYWQVLVPRDHPFASMRNGTGYVLEHRLVMAEVLGRPLLPNEMVHHIDGDRANNVPENLQLRIGKHGKGTVYRCRCCGSYDVEAVELAAVKDD